MAEVIPPSDCAAALAASVKPSARPRPLVATRALSRAALITPANDAGSRTSCLLPACERRRMRGHDGLYFHKRNAVNNTAAPTTKSCCQDTSMGQSLSPPNGGG